jgi:hypothetical protein
VGSGGDRRGRRVDARRPWNQRKEVKGNGRVPVRDGICGRAHGARRLGGRVHAPDGVAPEGPACCRWIPVTGGGLMWASTNARALARGKEVHPQNGRA